MSKVRLPADSASASILLLSGLPHSACEGAYEMSSVNLKEIKRQLQEEAARMNRISRAYNAAWPTRAMKSTREKRLQRTLELNVTEFQRLKNGMSKLQFEAFLDSVLKKEKPMENLPRPIEEESKPRSLREPRTLHEKMKGKRWVVQ